MIILTPDIENSIVTTKGQMNIDNSSYENAKYILKCNNENLYNEGDFLDCIYYLIQGKVLRFRKGEFDTKHLLTHAIPGTFLGLNALYNSSEVSHSAIVKGNSLLLVIPVFHFKNLLERWTNLKKEILGQLIHQSDLMESNISKF
jgi:CRP-like cAMP-binding protein